MDFPYITHINDVLPALEGRDEFVIAKKDGYTVIDYRYALHDSFDDPIRRECRGLKFGPAGLLIARPLHKFFNYGEKPETSLNGGVLDLDQNHRVMEKMDGSMIHPAIIETELMSANDEYTPGVSVRGEAVVFMTRMGHTDVAKQAERHFLLGREAFGQSLIDLAHAGVTPIFEYVGPDNRIVEAYEKPELVLLQARNMSNGAYASVAALELLAEDLGVRVAPTYPAFSSHQDLLDVYARDSGGEGVVLKWEGGPLDGLMMKVKTDEYRRLHRIRDDVSREHDLARLIIDGSIDDALPLFDQTTRTTVEAFTNRLLTAISRRTAGVNNLVVTGASLDQKTFAVEHLKGATAGMRACAFALRKDPSQGAQVVVQSFVHKHTKDAKAFDSIRDFLDGVKLDVASIYIPEGMAA